MVFGVELLAFRLRPFGVLGLGPCGFRCRVIGFQVQVN